MKKSIIFGSEALTQVAKGVEILAKTVGSTLGPGGRNVIFENLGFPMVTKDGVTVARQIELRDKMQNIGAQMVKQVANKTCEDAGDGTSTSCVLANAIVQEGLKVLSTGVNPISVQRGINKSIEEVIKYIESEIKQDVEEDSEKIRQIAEVSANWDTELGHVVADAIIEVGLDGGIRLAEDRGYETKYTIVDGLQFDRGYVAAQFVNNQAKQLIEMDNPYVLFYSGSLNDTEALLPLLKEAKREKANLFIIADEYDTDVMQQLVLSKIRSGVSVCAIKAPHYKDMRYDSMIDISILMGGTFIDPYGENPIALEDVRLRHCGRCDKVICSLYKTSFSGFGNISDADKKKEWKERLDARIADIKDLATDDEAEKLPRENAKLRLKQINAKAAIISLGASSEVEYQEKLDRADDALRAVRCAMTEGIVPGAGYSYLKATKCKGLTTLLKSTDDGEAIGYKELCAHIRGEKSLKEAIDEIKLASRRYAKRQITWFGRNKETKWIYAEETESFSSLLQDLINFLSLEGV